MKGGGVMTRLGKLDITTVAVPDNAVTSVLARNDNRRFLAVWNFSGTDVYIGYGESAPSGATEMHTLPDQQGIAWEEVVPITAVYAYQSSGSSVNIKVQEGE